MDKIGPLEMFLPITVGLDLVNEDSALFSPVSAQIALAVSVEIQPPDSTAATHPVLPDAGVHGSLPPRNVARESDVHG
jgi:hypothetical protein